MRLVCKYVKPIQKVLFLILNELSTSIEFDLESIKPT